jgi:hypothetical protein
MGAVPDLRAENDERTEIEAQLGRVGSRTVSRQPRRKPGISMPTPQATPLSEYNKSHPLLSWAFPSLYPRGRAEFVDTQPREVNYRDYVHHLLLYRDGRFARHPRWRYVVFNTLMRFSVNDKAGFFVNKLHPEQKDMTLDEIRKAFEDTSDEAEQIVNSITQYSAKLQGSRPY